MTERRYIFTVTAGRSGQGSLTDLLNLHVPGCLALFEEPQIRPLLPGALGDFERRFRRRFVETHELLGRGRVIEAFNTGDDPALDRFVADRLTWMERQAERANARIVADVSKYFARGMHRAFARARPDIGVIRLVRDPILNMRSFLNRNKDFYLDNSDPSARYNRLRLDPDELSKGELYLWTWCEMYLRFDALIDEFTLSPAIEIRTDDLNDAATMTKHLAALGFEHEPVAIEPPRNTNVSKGFGETAVQAVDIETFEQFRDRLPPEIVAQIPYFDDYDPRNLFATAA